MKQINLFTKISIRVIAVFLVAITMSAITDNLHEYLGDWFCAGRATDNAGLCVYYDGGTHNSAHDPTWHWGYRHWLVLFMGVSLAVIQIVNIVFIIEESNKK